jgi:transposase
MYQNFIGIDISKNDFYASLYGQKTVNVFPNTADGFSQFEYAYQQVLAQSLVILETTGGYELPLIHYLQTRNHAVHRANTRKVKHFIRSFGRLAKTDTIDAMALAHYGYERHSTLELYQENTQKQLVLLVQRRSELKKMLVQEKNRRQSPGLGKLKDSFDAIIDVIKDEINKLERQIETIVKQDPLLEDKRKILQTISGIGKIISIELLALLPELGTANRKKIASLAGLAPHPFDSGNKKGYRRTVGGRGEIKPIMFLAAMTAARSHSLLGQFYNRLVNAGKKKMVALTALMRKILVIANAKVRDLLALKQIPQHS